MSRNVKFLVMTLAFGFYLSVCWSQSNSDRQITFANQIKEESTQRTERAKAQIDENIDWISNVSREHVGKLIEAEYLCKSYQVTTQKRSDTTALFGAVDLELNKFSDENNLLQKSMERKLELAKNSYRRICPSGTIEDLETYSRCLIAREKTLGILNMEAGMKRLASIQDLYAIQPYEKYKQCVVRTGTYQESTFTPAVQSAVKTSSIVNGYFKKLNQAAEALSGY